MLEARFSISNLSSTVAGFHVSLGALPITIPLNSYPREFAVEISHIAVTFVPISQTCMQW